MSDQLSKLDQITFDVQQMWREEVYTDRLTGSIRVNIPVTADGQVDPLRKTEYYAQTSIMTGGGPIPVEGPIEANSLAEAAAKFGPATKLAVEEMIERAKEMQREAASQIVTPDQAFRGGGLGGGLGGGRGAGGPVTLR